MKYNDTHCFIKNVAYNNENKIEREEDEHYQMYSRRCSSDNFRQGKSIMKATTSLVNKNESNIKIILIVFNKNYWVNDQKRKAFSASLKGKSLPAIGWWSVLHAIPDFSSVGFDASFIRKVDFFSSSCAIVDRLFIVIRVLCRENYGFLMLYCHHESQPAHISGRSIAM